MEQDNTKVNASFEEKRSLGADTVTIEVRPHPTSGPIGNRREPNNAPFVPVEIPKSLADACRKLDHRRQYGVHISKIGGIDALAEFAMHGLRVLAKPFPSRGTGRNAVWAIPSFDMRFPVQN